MEGVSRCRQRQHGLPRSTQHHTLGAPAMDDMQAACMPSSAFLLPLSSWRACTGWEHTFQGHKRQVGPREPPARARSTADTMPVHDEMPRRRPGETAGFPGFRKRWAHLP